MKSFASFQVSVAEILETFETIKVKRQKKNLITFDNTLSNVRHNKENYF